MGRGQQMSVYDIEKSAGSGLRSMNKRRIVLVFLVTFFLPIVITSTYLYYTAPDAATEAMLFLQGRPFGLSPPSVFLPPFPVHKLHIQVFRHVVKGIVF